ncbi:MAG: subtilase, partial [Immundisolibacteraceae bacterium]|nr:subtilase [Immundisolibacteraceae bacterium]
DSGKWELGDKLHNMGSVHSDVWRGTAAELANCDHVAVYPVIGWWKERPKMEKWNKIARYALIISIKTPDVNTDIYTPITLQVETPISV